MKASASLIALILIFLLSCHDEVHRNTGLNGRWQLTEVLSDPGDGSGTFQKVTKRFVIEFTNDGRLQTYGTGNFLGEAFYTYSVRDSVRLLLRGRRDAEIRYQIDASGKTLTLGFLCDEACAERYKAIK